MKINLEFILKFFRKKNHHSRQRNVYGDWGMLLSIAFLCLVVVAAVDGIIFYKINRGELFNPPPKQTETLATFNRDTLKQENGYYDTEELQFKAQKAGSPDANVIDPAL